MKTILIVEPLVAELESLPAQAAVPDPRDHRVVSDMIVNGLRGT